jgi:hypothetical protein
MGADVIYEADVIYGADVIYRDDVIYEDDVIYGGRRHRWRRRLAAFAGIYGEADEEKDKTFSTLPIDDRPRNLWGRGRRSCQRANSPLRAVSVTQR